MHEIPPESLVNRSTEQEEFGALLSFQTEARLLAISDEAGTGKSSLLRILEYNLNWRPEPPWRMEPPAAVGLVSLDEETITSEFELVKQIRERLGALEFPEFDYLNSARVAHYWPPFARSIQRSPAAVAAGTTRGQFLGQGAEITGGQQAGVIYDIEHVGELHAPEEFPHNPDWANPGEQEPIAQRKCVEAFLGELKTAASQQPVVVLLDTYEAPPRGLREWILTQFIKPLSFDPGRPEKFVLGLAGTELPNFRAILGEKRYGDLVRTRDSLTWEEEHVRDFLNVHGYEGLSEEDVALVCTRVAQGFSISRALKLADALTPI